MEGAISGPRRSRLGLAVAVLCAASLTSACSAAGPAASAVGTVPSVVPSVVAGATSGSPSSAPSSSSSIEPPSASLAAEGGDPAVGQLGSFTWNGGGSDSPWLPGSPITVGAGERLTVSLAGGDEPTDWSARRVPAGTPDGSGAVGIGGGPAPITFAAPGPGSWSVQVQVRFAGGLGSAAYYWELSVR
jgi:hypothetical protein